MSIKESSLFILLVFSWSIKTTSQSKQQIKTTSQNNDIVLFFELEKKKLFFIMVKAVLRRRSRVTSITGKRFLGTAFRISAHYRRLSLLPRLMQALETSSYHYGSDARVGKLLGISRHTVRYHRLAANRNRGKHGGLRSV
jgi:hypothetical protein